ncbi:uncharacterized protein CLUP02_02196 [Colletotrichum lupini]|uniref:Uncharacterized protein n=2 Tax=Colletotrichum acutatum species complex TaxID=2707335 RepID=A0A9Q8SFG8_9PEZI|nr:uncharacterized protein CLUP02_02196 [Colletotrichum lupini]XP_060380939.1 uncharacterized protein CTAM01_08406 [Colletotrichum tamarilloi]KAK1496219.1 hypothetical protein CTAM01_08406 [Colletotrichum tamarilloi]UQC75542.1 hypothetical protein CLUP02_02196 [Colletotrichum lupini]
MILGDRVRNSGERPMLCKQMQATKLKTRTWVSDRRNPS